MRSPRRSRAAGPEDQDPEDTVDDLVVVLIGLRCRVVLGQAELADQDCRTQVQESQEMKMERETSILWSTSAPTVRGSRVST